MVAAHKEKRPPERSFHRVERMAEQLALQFPAAAQPLGEISHLDHERNRFGPGSCIGFDLPEKFRGIGFGHSGIVADLAQVFSHVGGNPFHVMAVGPVVVQVAEYRNGIKRLFRIQHPGCGQK